MNLICNSLESLAGTAAPDRRVTVQTLNRWTEIEVVVSDTGCGIDPGVQPHLFAFFATTKPGRLGIGLAITRWIIEAHHGRIWVDPPGRQPGTTMHLTLRCDSNE